MGKKYEIEVKNRKSANAKLMDFCYLANKHDVIEVTEWTNGEGFDVTINDVSYMMTHGQLKAIRMLVKKLNKSYVAIFINHPSYRGYWLNYGEYGDVGYWEYHNMENTYYYIK